MLACLVLKVRHNLPPPLCISLPIALSHTLQLVLLLDRI
jgi:hypothetical protein